MSARKRTTVTLSEEQYQKLYEEKLKNKYLKRDLPKISEEIRQDTQKFLQESLSLIKSRDNSFQDYLKGLDGELFEFESRTSEALLRQQNEFVEMVDEQAFEMWDQTQKLLENIEENFSRNIQQTHRERQTEIKLLEDRLQDLQLKDEDKQSIAVEWINNGRALTTFIEENYSYQIFYPDRLDNLRRSLNQAQRNYQSALYEAALLGAQDVYFQLSDFRIDLEKKVQEWDLLYNTVLAQTSRLQYLISENEYCPIYDLKGDALDLKVQMNEWSAGDYEKLQTYISQLFIQLHEKKELLDLETLRNLQEETLPEVEKDFENLIRDVNFQVINSQIRINIADLVMRAFKEQGFVLQKSGYQEGDLRSSYVLDVKNLEGSEVIVEVQPGEAGFQQNDLLIISLDHEQRTRHELRQRSKEISKSLQKFGLQTGTTSTQPDQRPPDMSLVHEVELRSRPQQQI